MHEKRSHKKQENAEGHSNRPKNIFIGETKGSVFGTFPANDRFWMLTFCKDSIVMHGWNEYLDSSLKVGREWHRCRHYGSESIRHVGCLISQCHYHRPCFLSRCTGNFPNNVPFLGESRPRSTNCNFGQPSEVKCVTKAANGRWPGIRCDYPTSIAPGTLNPSVCARHKTPSVNQSPIVLLYWSESGCSWLIHSVLVPSEATQQQSWKIQNTHKILLPFVTPQE